MVVVSQSIVSAKWTWRPSAPVSHSTLSGNTAASGSVLTSAPEGTTWYP